jgi:CubicO group peptidase (beta-lactamase class C family)
MPPIESLLLDGIRQDIHPGAQLYASIHGTCVLHVAVGDARAGQAMTPDSLTLWMSAGKPVAAVAALMLVERGLLALDTRVVELIPDFAQNGKGSITLHQLLTHTAGFRGPLNNFTPGTFAQIVERVNALRQEPGWVPGEKAGYHIGSSWFTLGELVRVASGLAFDRFVRDELFRAIGVTDAYIGMTEAEYEALEPHFALMHVTEKLPVSTDWPGNTRDATITPRPGANARGPIQALARLYESLLFDDRLLSEPMRQAMRSRQRQGMLDATFQQTLDWGYGVMIDSKRYAGEHIYGFGPHESDDAFGHSGNQSSCAFADPRHGLVVAWTCNGMPGEPRHQARARAINAAIYETLGLA